MRIGDFGLRIPEGKETVDGYVQLKHNTEYVVNLYNYSRLDCDAILSIDGSKVGTYRVPANNIFPVSRPPSVERNFIFLKLGTNEATQANLQATDKLGLITVEFIPASNLPTRNLPPLELYGATKGATTRSFSAGGTGLGSYTDQKFSSAQEIDRDYTKKVTINLRLVATEPQPAIIPLHSSNPVPPSLL